MQLDHYRLINEADDKCKAYADLIADIAYEEGGILFSEAFFLHLCVGQFEPLRIMESGRGKGTSTELLAKTFGDMPVVSIDTVDDPVARERTSKYENVELHTGDSRKLMHELSRSGDYILIDGPSGMDGLKLLLELFGTRKFEMGFLHDAGPGTPVREYVQKHFGEAFYSDDPEFAEIAHVLDAKAEASLPADKTWAANEGKFGYGYGMICLPYDARNNYGSMARKLKVSGLFGKLFGKK